MEQPRPYILFTSIPIRGHFTPLLALGRALLGKGYRCGFLCGSHFADEISSAGLDFFRFHSACDFTSLTLNEDFPGREGLDAKAKLDFDVLNVLLGPVASQYESLRDTIAEVGVRTGNEDVVVVSEIAFYGLVPAILHYRRNREIEGGQWSSRVKGFITIGGVALLIPSIDTAPYGSCLPGDSSVEGRIRNAELYKQRDLALQPVHDAFLAKVQSTGLADIQLNNFVLETTACLTDHFLQMGCPSFEYPRSDLPAHVQFMGAAPIAEPSHEQFLVLDSMLGKCRGKQLIAVAQSTIQEDVDFFSNLIIPTITAFANSPNHHVIAILSRRGASLPDSLTIPDNVSVFDFLPFELVFPHLDVFVYEGGFGGVVHAMRHGVPLVLAPYRYDHPDTAVRLERFGNGINLKTGMPRPEVVREAVERILDEKMRFKERAMLLKREMEGFDCISVVEGCIGELMTRKG